MVNKKRKPRSHACTLASIVSFYRTDRKYIRATWFSRFIQAVRNCSTISIKHPLTNSMFRSTKTVIEEKRRHEGSKFWYVIHPFSMFQFWWKLFMSFIYVLVVWMDSYYEVIVSKSHKLWSDQFLWLSVVFNTVYAVDIIINFLTGYVESYEHPLVFNAAGIQKYKSKRITFVPRKIAWHYLRTFFFIDAITFMNLFVFFFCTYETHKDLWYNLTIIRIFRCARLYTSYRTAQIILSNPNYSYNIPAFAVFVCATIFFIASYSFAFFYLIVPDIVAFYKGKEHTNYSSIFDINFDKWQGYPPTDKEILMRVILKSYGIFLGITMIGDYFNYAGPTRIILCVNTLVGIILRAFFFYTVFVCLNNMYNSRVKYEGFMKEVSHLMFIKEMNNYTEHRVVTYFQNTLKMEKFNEEQTLDALQPRMRYEIFVRSSMDLVRTCHLFSNLPNQIISSLAFRLKYETYIPGIYVVRVGERANCMYFIANGCVAIYNRDGAEICHLSDGEYFGEIGLMSISSATRIADVITIDNSYLYRLDIKDFHEVVTPNSLIYQRLRQWSLHRVSVRRKSVFTPPIESSF